MKKTMLLSTMTTCAVLLLTHFPSKATVWRVNNNGAPYVQYTGQQVFSDLAFAIATASAGDTLHIEASPTVYNTSAIHITKKLIIIGPGYLFGGTNGNSNLQANHNVSKVSTLYFDAGSEYSVYMGITQVGILYVRASNITIKRNQFFDDCVLNLNGTSAIFYLHKTISSIKIFSNNMFAQLIHP